MMPELVQGWPDVANTVLCDGCDQPAHPHTGSHPTCTRCLFAIDAPEGEPFMVGCGACIVDVLTFAGQFDALENESYKAAVQERLDRLRRREL